MEVRAQSRQAAIAAALDAWDGLDDVPWVAMEAALDAALAVLTPHLQAEALREAADLFRPGGINDAVRAILIDAAARTERGV